MSSTEEQQPPTPLTDVEAAQQRSAAQSRLADELLARAQSRLQNAARAVTKVYRPGTTVSSVTEDEVVITDSEIAAAMRQLNVLSDLTVFYEFATEYFKLPKETVDKALEGAMLVVLSSQVKLGATPPAGSGGDRPAPNVMTAIRKHERNLVDD